MLAATISFSYACAKNSQAENRFWKFSLLLVRAQLREKQGLVRLAGIEPTTLGFGGRYSIH